jgi:cobalt-zinc-cadmium efflux system membrane fusion protein
MSGNFMRLCAAAFALIVPLAGACSSDRAAPAKAEAPAHVEAPRTEAELTTVKLSPEAVKRLGIETAVARVETASATRSLGGEVTVPEGHMVTVTAPVAGTVSVAAGVQPGARVSRGSRLMTLAPLASSERDQSIEARRAVEAARADAETARLRLQRLEQLLKDGAASVRSVEEARGQLQVAEAALSAAKERLAAFRQGPVGPEGEIAIAAPLDGVVQAISVAPGQTVAAAAPLLQITQVSTLWVRVPVFAGDADQIDATQPASVRRLGGAEAPRAARRVTAPLKADPAAASIDLYYELSASGVTFRPGERVMTELPLRQSEQGLVVPEAALLYDMHGDAWVYEDIGGNAYARRRVQVARHAGDLAVIARGIPQGAKVVTAGAAELFGTEFGAGH